MVPPAEFTSYYGKPVLNEPAWAAPDIAGYLFLGGLAGGSSLLAAGADLTGRPELARVAKARGGRRGAVSLGLLVHDLGRPARFLQHDAGLQGDLADERRVLAAGRVRAGVRGGGSGGALTGRLPRPGAVATAGAAVLGAAGGRPTRPR